MTDTKRKNGPTLDFAVTHEEAFMEYATMERPSMNILAIKYKELEKKEGKPYPTRGTLHRWARLENWKARVAEIKRQGVLAAAAQAAGLVIPSEQFSARDELRTMAAQLTKILKEVTAGKISSQAKEILANSVNIQRLGATAMECIKLAEELQDSVPEKDAEETTATPEEHKAESQDYLAVAMRQLKTTKQDTGEITQH